MRNLRRLFGYLRPYRWPVVQAIFLIIVSTLLGLVMPRITQFVIDQVFYKKHFEWLLWVALGLLGWRVFLGLISYLRNYLLIFIGQRVIFDLRYHIYRHLQKLSMRYYESRQGGKILSRVMWDVDAVQGAITGGFINIVTDALTVIAIIVITLVYNWKLACLGLTVMPLYAFNFMFLRKRLTQTYKRIREKVADITGTLSEKIAGAKVVKSFVREKYEIRHFIHDIRENYGLNLRAGKLGTWLWIIASFISGVGGIIVLYWGGLAIKNGQLTVGAYIAFTTYLGMLYGPIERLTQITDVLQRATTAAERIFEVLDTEPDVEEAPQAIVLPTIKGKVEFRNVSFGYQPDQLVLKDINLSVPPGTVVALVGPSGGGKTTFVNLIPRFYDPTRGAIYVDNYNIREVALNSLRQQIGIVLQETFLFSGTIKDNIRYGKVEATDKEIVEAAKIANAHEFIMELPEKYETEIGERGVRLSVGQKQRIAIARAVLRNPKILILDEATSSLDTESEVLIQEAMDYLMKTRTTFVIAHRLSTILNADKIVVIDNGEIIEEGKHHELLERGGLYAHLYAMQFERAPAVSE